MYTNGVNGVVGLGQPCPAGTAPEVCALQSSAPMVYASLLALPQTQALQTFVQLGNACNFFQIYGNDPVTLQKALMALASYGGDLNNLKPGGLADPCMYATAAPPTPPAPPPAPPAPPPLDIVMCWDGVARAAGTCPPQPAPPQINPPLPPLPVPPAPPPGVTTTTTTTTAATSTMNWPVIALVAAGVGVASAAIYFMTKKAAPKANPRYTYSGYRAALADQLINDYGMSWDHANQILDLEIHGQTLSHKFFKLDLPPADAAKKINEELKHRAGRPLQPYPRTAYHRAMSR